MNSIDTRQHVHSLVDQLPPAQLAVIEGLLCLILDPVAHSWRSAATDDEPVTEQESQAVRRSEEWFRHRGGIGIPMEEVLAEFGLSLTDFPLKNRST